MPISLTQEQFYQRLDERRRLLIIAIDEDVKAIFPIKTQVIVKQTEINIDLRKPISELLLKTMVRVVNLVYEEGLD